MKGRVLRTSPILQRLDGWALQVQNALNLIKHGWTDFYDEGSEVSNYKKNKNKLPQNHVIFAS